MTEVDAVVPAPAEDGVIQADGTPDPAHRIAVSYIDRSRRYYAALGYEEPYRWVTNDSAPFQKLRRPVDASRLAVVTTTFPVEHQDGPRPPRSVRAIAADPPPEQMYTDDLFWHKAATNTDDVESFLPLRTLAGFVADRRLGSVNDRFFAVPTTYSQRSTQGDAETVAAWCDEDDVDLVMLIPL